MRMLARLPNAPSVLALSLLVAGVARADAPSASTDEQKAAARLLGTEGVKLAMSGDCAGAVDKLSRAEALVHAPTTALPLAQCEIKLGKLVAGTEVLNRLVHESLPATAPKSWVDAKQQAQPLLDATVPRIARLRIHVDRPGGALADVQVTVDGEPVNAVLLDNDRPTDPGPHHVAATAPATPPAAADVVLRDGQTQPVHLQLEPPASAPPAPATATPTYTAPLTTESGAPASASSHGPNRVPAYVLFGVGGAGVVIGTVFGVLALSAKSSLNSACVNHVCPTSSQGNIDAYHTDPVVSTVAFGVGVVALAVGAVLFLTAHEESPRAGSLHVHPWVGPGSAGLGGTF